MELSILLTRIAVIFILALVSATWMLILMALIKYVYGDKEEVAARPKIFKDKPIPPTAEEIKYKTILDNIDNYGTSKPQTKVR